MSQFSYEKTKTFEKYLPTDLTPNALQEISNTIKTILNDNTLNKISGFSIHRALVYYVQEETALDPFSPYYNEYKNLSNIDDDIFSLWNDLFSSDNTDKPKKLKLKTIIGLPLSNEGRTKSAPSMIFEDGSQITNIDFAKFHDLKTYYPATKDSENSEIKPGEVITVMNIAGVQDSAYHGLYLGSSINSSYSPSDTKPDDEAADGDSFSPSPGFAPSQSEGAYNRGVICDSFISSRNISEDKLKIVDLILTKFKEAGLSPAIAYGAIVNAYSESGFNPTIQSSAKYPQNDNRISKLTGKSVAGQKENSFGLFQMNCDFGACVQRGLTPEQCKDPNINIDNMILIAKSDPSFSKYITTNSDNFVEAASKWCNYLERPKSCGPNDPDPCPEANKRGELAKKIICPQEIPGPVNPLNPADNEEFKQIVRTVVEYYNNNLTVNVDDKCRTEESYYNDSTTIIECITFDPNLSAQKQLLDDLTNNNTIDLNLLQPATPPGP